MTSKKYHREYMRWYREQRKQKKVCVNCADKLDNNYRKYCDSCLSKERKRNRAGWRRFRIKELERGRTKHFKYKIVALQKVSKIKIPFCVVCKAKDVRILTINHKNGDGALDKWKGGFYVSIALNKREVDDLEVRCYNCNKLYEYERGRTKLPKKWRKIIKNSTGDVNKKQ